MNDGAVLMGLGRLKWLRNQDYILFCGLCGLLVLWSREPSNWLAIQIWPGSSNTTT